LNFFCVLKRHRCLIPTSAYYQWEDTPDGKQPHYFTARDGSPVLAMAGLWDRWTNVETEEQLLSGAEWHGTLIGCGGQFASGE
jgi:putative SOS response-associated peptidase YedK